MCVLRLTAWAVRIFSDASYPGWEFQFWIDPSVFLGTFRWLLARQDSNGCFVETERTHPFDGRFSGNVITRV